MHTHTHTTVARQSCYGVSDGPCICIMHSIDDGGGEGKGWLISTAAAAAPTPPLLLLPLVWVPPVPVENLQKTIVRCSGAGNQNDHGNEEADA